MVSIAILAIPIETYVQHYYAPIMFRRNRNTYTHPHQLINVARRILFSGIQGTGKTTLLNEVKRQGVDCTTISGSDALRHVIGTSDLSDFDKFSKEERTKIRSKAVDYLKELSRTRAHPLIIDGHLILRNRATGEIEVNWNEHDQRLYTEIIVLNIDAETILERRLGDSRERALILDSVIEEMDAELNAIERFITDKPLTFIEQTDLSLATNELRSILEPKRRIASSNDAPDWLNIPDRNRANIIEVAADLNISDGQPVILIDADRTLTPFDSVAELYSMVEHLSWNQFCAGFRHFGYTFEAFREAIIATSEINTETYLKSCAEVANSIHLHLNAIDLLKGLHSGPGYPIIVTCGSPTIWRQLLDQHDCYEIPIFGGAHFGVDQFLIGKAEKGFLAHFFKKNGHRLISIGDSEVDELMMQQSDLAVMAHNHKHNRDLLPGLVGIKDVRQWSQTGESDAISDFDPITFDQIMQIVEEISND
jgi:adenylate kinase